VREDSPGRNPKEPYGFPTVWGVGHWVADTYTRQAGYRVVSFANSVRTYGDWAAHGEARTARPAQSAPQDIHYMAEESKEGVRAEGIQLPSRWMAVV